MVNVFDFLRRKKTNGNDLQAVVAPAEEKPNFLSQFLPEDPDSRAALARSLIMGGASAMAAGGPSAEPTNLLSVLGSGLAGGVQSYDKSLATAADTAKTRFAVQAANAKTQKEEEARALWAEFYERWGDPGPNGYPPEALAERARIQAALGDDEGQRQTVGFIQNLNQAAGDKLMTPGPDGSFINAPGTVDAAAELAAREEAAKVAERNRELTATMKDRNAGIDPARDKYLEEAGKKDAAEMSDAYADAAKSKTLAADMQQYIALQNRAGSGKWAELKVQFGPWFQAMGMDVEGLDENQAMQALQSRIAPQLRVAGSGATSDYDAQQFMNSVPNLARTPEGNKIVADTFSAITAQKQRVAEIWTRTQTPGDEFYGKPYLARKAISELPDPYANFKAAQKEASEQGTSTPQSGASPKATRVPTISTQAEFNALPSGTYFMKDGKRYRKP